MQNSNSYGKTSREEYIEQLRLTHPYTNEQIREIAEYKNFSSDKWFPRPDLNSQQLREIRLGKEAGLPVEKYDSFFLPPEIMQTIRLGLEEGFDISGYVLKGFSYSQLHQIRLGVQDLLDVSQYAELWFSTDKMESIRKSMLSALPTRNKIYIFKSGDSLGLLDNFLVVAESLYEAQKQLQPAIEKGAKIRAIPIKVLSPLEQKAHPLNFIF